jgi:hypothetical protein
MGGVNDVLSRGRREPHGQRGGNGSETQARDANGSDPADPYQTDDTDSVS